MNSEFRNTAAEPAPSIEAGLPALNAQGLALAEMAGGTVLEQLEWHPVPADMPDAETTVLLQYIDPVDGSREMCTGWWDGLGWRECSSGGLLDAVVTYWAEPAGPKA